MKKFVKANENVMNRKLPHHKTETANEIIANGLVGVRKQQHANVNHSN